MGATRGAAERAGIGSTGIGVGALMFTGWAAAIAALLFVSQTATADPNVGIGYELDVIAAVIIGGAKPSGRSGTGLGSGPAMLLPGLIRPGLLLGGETRHLLIVRARLDLVVALGRPRSCNDRAPG